MSSKKVSPPVRPRGGRVGRPDERPEGDADERPEGDVDKVEADADEELREAHDRWEAGERPKPPSEPDRG